MAVPITTASFRDVVEPNLNVVFDGIYNAYPKEYSEYLNVKQGIKRASHEEPVLFPYAIAPVKQQGAPIASDVSGEAGVARYVYVVYGTSFALTEELMEDGDHIGILKIQTTYLARSMYYTKELVCANVLNNGFNGAYAGYDGQPLFSASHVSGPNSLQSNTLQTATSLSQAGLEQMLSQIRVAKDGRGKIIHLKPQKLLVPPQLWAVAERLTASPLQSGTANNDINAVKNVYGLKWMQVTLLSSPTAWFINTDAPFGLTYLDRRAINTQSLGDFESGNMRYRATMRFAVGFTDPLGAYGTQGM